MAQGLLFTQSAPLSGHRVLHTGDERNLPMTQELILGVLLVGLVVLVWAMTVSVLWTDGDHAAREEASLEASSEARSYVTSHGDQSKRRTVAA